MSTAHRLVVVVTAAVAVLAGCGAGADVRAYLDNALVEQAVAGDTVTYLSGMPVADTTATIVGAVEPAARATDGGAEYLRYDEDIVVVDPAAGGSNVRVEGLAAGFAAGAYAFLGPGFSPGSPAGTGDDDAK